MSYKAQGSITTNVVQPFCYLGNKCKIQILQADDQVKKANIEIAVTKLDKDPIEVV